MEKCKVETDITLEPAGIDPSVMAELIAAAPYAATGVRDSAVFRKACEEIDHIRERNARLRPGPPVGVDIIREMRDNRHPASIVDE
jgi:hypothetical protein